MTQPAIFIAVHNAPEYVSLLSDQLDSHVEIATASSLKETVSRYTGQPIVLARPDFATALLKTEPPVKWVQSTWAGVTPLIELPFRNYQLTGLKGVFGTEMSEYVLGYVLAHELDMNRRKVAQMEGKWDQSPNGRMAGKTLGVMGTGSIGAHLGLTAQQLGLRVLGFNSSGTPTEPFERVYKQASLATFLRQCDYVVGILPDLPETTDVIDSKALAVMKESAVLINVGRGNLIDELALCQALQQGQIAAAVLDVFKQEPLPEDSPLWTAANCTITAHVAAVSHPQDIVKIFLENYRLFEAGKPLNHLINFDKGY